MANKNCEAVSYETYVEFFRQEFSHLLVKFEDPVQLNAKEAFSFYMTWIEAKRNEKPRIPEKYPTKPGVYAYWHKEENGFMCWRVGKSRKKVFFRAMQHIRDQTQSKDGSIKISPEAQNLFVAFFCTKEEKDVHWVLALEDYFEEILKPSIESRRG